MAEGIRRRLRYEDKMHAFTSSGVIGVLKRQVTAAEREDSTSPTRPAVPAVAGVPPPIPPLLFSPPTMMTSTPKPIHRHQSSTIRNKSKSFVVTDDSKCNASTRVYSARPPPLSLSASISLVLVLLLVLLLLLLLLDWVLLKV